MPDTWSHRLRCVFNALGGGARGEGNWCSAAGMKERLKERGSAKASGLHGTYRTTGFGQRGWCKRSSRTNWAKQQGKACLFEQQEV
jgi:hypothetical protein